MLLALDPGIVSPGVALFSGGVLVASSRILVRKKDACLGARWKGAAEEIVSWAKLEILRRGVGADIKTFVYEKPKIYTREKSKGDPDDLLGLCAIGAGVAMSSLCQGATVFTYEPSEWIGQISKVCPACGGKAKKKCAVCKGSAWETPRGRYIRGVMTPAELAIAHDQNDEIDSIGIGLHHLGRLKPRRVYSNGRDGS